MNFLFKTVHNFEFPILIFHQIGLICAFWWPKRPDIRLSSILKDRLLASARDDSVLWFQMGNIFAQIALKTLEIE